MTLVQQLLCKHEWKLVFRHLPDLYGTGTTVSVQRCKKCGWYKGQRLFQLITPECPTCGK